MEVNDAFLSLFGHLREDLLDGSIKAFQLTTAEDRRLLKLARRFPDNVPDDPIQLSCVDDSGDSVPAEISIYTRSIEGHQLLYGSLRDISETIRHQEQQEEA